MTQLVKVNDWVTVHFTLIFKNGVIYTSTQNQDPVAFKVGDNQVLLGIETAVLGMGMGQQKRVMLSPEETFGHKEDALKVPFSRSAVPDHVRCELGQKVEITQDKFPPFRGIISYIDDDTLVVDGNFPMSGNDMELSIEVVDISETPY